MNIWPVPESYDKIPPKKGQPGSFWESRENKYHNGIDIYAPYKADVLAVSEGKVIKIDKATTPEQKKYWNTTYYIIIKTKSNFVMKYSELDSVNIKEGAIVKPGEKIAEVGQVLNEKLIDSSSPVYIQEMKKKNRLSMLHFEMHSLEYIDKKNFLTGNIFEDKIPEDSIDPTDFLNTLN